MLASIPIVLKRNGFSDRPIIALRAGPDPGSRRDRLCRFSLYGLRHSAATILFNHMGKDLREIQELLRHKNIRTAVR
jgi:integrase